MAGVNKINDSFNYVKSEEYSPYPELEKLGQIHLKSLNIFLGKKKETVVQEMSRSKNTSELLNNQGKLILLNDLIGIFSKKDL